jgi:hypothetical protein
MKRGFVIFCILISFVGLANFQSFDKQVYNVDALVVSKAQSRNNFVQSKSHSSIGVKVNFEFSVQASQSLGLKKSKLHLQAIFESIFVSQHESASEIIKLNQNPITYCIAFTTVDAIYPFHFFW